MRTAGAFYLPVVLLGLLLALPGDTVLAALPPAGTDASPVTGWLYLDLPGLGADLVKVQGQGILRRQAPDPSVPTQVQTELVTLDLDGVSPILGAVHVTLTPGTVSGGIIIAPNSGMDTPFYSSLVVYFHVDLPTLGAALEAFDPIGLLARDTSIPLRQTHRPDPKSQSVALIDPATGTTRGSLRHAALDFNPAVVLLETQGQMSWTFQGQDENVDLAGTSLLVSSSPVDPGDGRSELNSDLLSLDLAGTSALGPLRLLEQDARICSGRAKASAAGAAFPASASFDVPYRLLVGGFDFSIGPTVGVAATVPDWPAIGPTFSSDVPVMLLTRSADQSALLGSTSWAWTSAADQCVDADGDGVFAPPCGDDCDDTDPRNFPGNFEDCGDGRDNDCDGRKDCQDPACDGRACDDGDACTRSDICRVFDGTCAGTPVFCGDGDPCTLDRCNPQTGQCENTPPNCDDGNPCTNDGCNPFSGQCQHLQVQCDDGNLCTRDACDPQTGACVSTPARSCDDHDPCTTDSCDPATGLCQHDLVACDDADACTFDLCDSKSGTCVHTPSVFCDDGDPCTVDSCDPATGTCRHTPLVCDDGNRCTTDACDPQAGGCVAVPIVCDDGDECTTDTCDPATGACVHTPLACDDGSSCTQDSCDPNRGCVFTAVPDGTACDDGNLCTTGDQCAAGRCAATPVVCADTDVCTIDSCDPATGQCVFAPVSCDDGNACTTDRCVPACVVPDDGGTATLPPHGCSYTSAGSGSPGFPGLPGTSLQATALLYGFTCPPSGPATCSFDPHAPGVECVQPGGSLGGDESCAEAVLRLIFSFQGLPPSFNRSVDLPVSLEIHSTPRVAGDTVQTFATDLYSLSGEIAGDPTFDLLRIQGGTAFGMPSPGHTTLTRSGDGWAVEGSFDLAARIDYTLAPGVPFQGGSSGSFQTIVRLATGGPACAHDPVNLNCDDGNPCTADACDPATGQCAHAPAVCDDGNPCTQDSCDPATGVCRHLPAPDGAPCDDGNACTQPDACRQGICAGAPATCDDGDPCTIDACDPKIGCFSRPSSCDDGNPCTADACDSATGQCRHDPLADDTPCDDATACTIGDHCAAGQCVPTSTIQCDDGNPCTDDVCDPKSGACLSFTKPEGTACDDGDPCTTGDQCLGGQCTGAPVVCSDDDVCTIDACDPATGVCGHTPISCDDGDACTTDRCVPGCIVPDSGGTAALPPQGCGYASSFTPPPGLPIQISGVLRDFVCPATGPGVCSFATPVPGVDCDQPGGSLGGDEACAGATLSLTFQGVPGLSRLDLPVGLEIHSAPRTPGDPVQSFDADLFRLDGEITGNPAFQLLRIVGGTDFGMPSPGHTKLTRSGDGWAVDGSFDLSFRVDFVAGPGLPFLPRQSGSYGGTAHLTTGAPACAHDPLHLDCDDGDACTVDACDPATGQCGHSPVSCDDGNPCTEDACDPRTGCVHRPVPDGTACDDGNACTQPDACAGGVCAGTPVTCSDGDPCTTDACDQKLGCVHAPVSCDDGNACTHDACDPATGQCRHDLLPDDSPCDDGDACTTGDRCAAGRCAGAGTVCDDGNPCTQDRCDPLGGKCVYTAEPDGTACDDGNLCTTGDQCRGGQCAAVPVVCADADVCTTDACDPATGQCVHAPLSCDDGNACTADRCEPTCVVPDDGDTSTLPPAGCAYGSGFSSVPGAPFQVSALLKDFACPATDPGTCSFPPPSPGVDCDQTGGLLGGGEACSSAVLTFMFRGIPGLDHVDLPVSLEMHAAPRSPGEPVQSFAIDVFRLEGGITGSPDFVFLQIEAGTYFGMPGPGRTTLMKSASGWTVESFFDLSYRIDFTGTSGGALHGLAGSFTGVARLTTGAPACAHDIVAPLETGTILFSDAAHFAWPASIDASQYNAYRGTIPDANLGSRPPGGVYDQVCHESADAFGDGATVSLDASDPSLGTAFYYLITAEIACGESIPGRASDGTPIPNAAPCPTPP